MNKQLIENFYDQFLKDVEQILGNKTTFGSQLHELSKELFGNDFVGVFPSDEIPKMKSGQMAILNLDKRSQGGSHWISVVKDNGNILFYDSFARKANKIIPSLEKSGNGGIIETEDDVEQGVKQLNCGPRSISCLLIYYLFGAKAFLLI